MHRTFGAWVSRERAILGGAPHGKGRMVDGSGDRRGHDRVATETELDHAKR
ncbi:hypothetical protein [Xaviernesmea oryzae]|uniref:hypothetical protein n=1 Tax=Xaviernesmea oryzae TaxID=464029 RepID=UPI0015880C5B|nr:hypothetical protein [Xaviernesmea oryzae]